MLRLGAMDENVSSATLGCTVIPSPGAFDIVVKLPAGGVAVMPRVGATAPWVTRAAEAATVLLVPMNNVGLVELYVTGAIVVGAATVTLGFAGAMFNCAAGAMTVTLTMGATEPSSTACGVTTIVELTLTIGATLLAENVPAGTATVLLVPLWIPGDAASAVQIPTGTTIVQSRAMPGATELAVQIAGTP